MHGKTVVELRRMARERGIKIPSSFTKMQIVERLSQESGALLKPEVEAVLPAAKEAAPAGKPVSRPEAQKKTEPEAEKKAEAAPATGGRRVPAAMADRPVESERRFGGVRGTLRAGYPKNAAPQPHRNVRTVSAAPRFRGESAVARSNGDNRPPRGETAAQGAPADGGRVNPRGEYRIELNRPAQARESVRPAPRAEGRESGGAAQLAENARPAAHGGHGEGAGRIAPRPELRDPGDRMNGGRVVQHPEGGTARPAAPAAVNRAEAEMPRPRAGYGEYNTSNPAVPEMIQNGECREGGGVLELMQDGYGFLRAENYTQGPNDIYVAINQIRRFNLRTGDYVKGKTRAQREGDRYEALLYITEINGRSPEEQGRRVPFENLTPVYPDERIRLEDETEAGRDLALRTIDLFAPIGKGQRGLIVSQPKAGKTVLLKKIANSITRNHPEIHLIVLLIDERPEEVTDMRRSISGEVVSSTFDEAPENHARVAEMVFGRAQRLVENGRDVVILMDSITRLARAYNLVNPPTGRSLSGGLDPGALRQPKRFFGSARNLEHGGSLTVIATALVETGSRMDDIIYEEFKGTGNMEIHLNRKLSERRIFPAIDIEKSGTRRDELLLTEREQAAVLTMRRLLNGDAQEITEQLIDMMSKTLDNSTFLDRIEGWARRMK
ncbi:MAG: transcription termination factor Rho [Clostridia bacterium]|nr:transcription termination factor Rho [Clostridia bacterium]